MTPLTLTAVIAEDVGSSRDDGTAGSGLYAIPIGLNRAPDGIESELLEAHWNRPQSFSTVHRPGILRVLSDRLVLDGTTIDEVERYHAATLALVIEQTNADAASIRAQPVAHTAGTAQADQDHADHVEDIAGEIIF